MTPPPDEMHRVHLRIAREEQPEDPPGVVRLPPRPGETLMVKVDLRDRIDATESAARMAMQCGLRVEGKVDALTGKVDGIDGRTERIETTLLRELPRLDFARAARDETRVLAEIVGHAPDLAALAHASHTDLTPEHIARLDGEAKFGTGIFKMVSEVKIQLGRVERRVLIGAGLSAAVTTHGPDLVVAAASLGWPGVALLALVVAALALVAFVRRKAAK